MILDEEDGFGGLDFRFQRSEEVWKGEPVFDIYDRNEKIVASVVGKNSHMWSVSVFDHLTEPRRKQDYSIEPTEYLDGTTLWSLLWDVLGNKIEDQILYLGEVRTQAEAEFLLKYIQEHGEDN